MSKVKEIKGLRGSIPWYAVQAIPPIDAEIGYAIVRRLAADGTEIINADLTEGATDPLVTGEENTMDRWQRGCRCKSITVLLPDNSNPN